MGKLTTSHRSTADPCSVPGLGRLAGAGRIGLTRGKSKKIINSYQRNVYFQKKKNDFYYRFVNESYYRLCCSKVGHYRRLFLLTIKGFRVGLQQTHIRMENNRTQNKISMTYGAICGLIGVVLFMVFYFMGTDIQSKAPQYLSYSVLAIIIILGIKSYRDQDLGGYISYSKALGTGTLISLYSGIISAAFSIIFFMFIAPEMTEQIIAAAQENMAKQGVSEEQMQVAIEWTRKFMQPTWLFLFSVITTVFIGFIFSLLISVFLKKEDTPFNSNIG